MKNSTKRTLVGERIRETRETLGLNQRSFAESLKVSPSFISEIEKGKTTPGITLLESIYRIYGVDLNWVVSGDKKARDDGSTGTPGTEQPEPSFDPGLFVPLPLYDLEVAAGGGAATEQENILMTLAFRRDWLTHEGLHSSKLLLLRVAGDSMEPTIYDGGTILVDRAQAQTRNEKIYVFRYGAEGYVKRLRKVEDRIIVVSDNRAYPEWEVPLAELVIIGRVVWAARKFP